MDPAQKNLIRQQASRQHTVKTAEQGRMFICVTLLLLCLGAGSGCTHIPLRKNTINQANTIGDIQQQQVLDNLAMFVYDANSMPSFAYPTQGTNQVVNTAAASLSNGWGIPSTGSHAGDFMLTSIGLNVNGSHQSNEAFTLIPVNDNRKLELMRCAFQRAVAGCTGNEPPKNCPDCQARLNTFYTGDPQGNIREKAGSGVHVECISKDCWFHFGCRKCVPKHCKCLKVGHYCGVYVWVTADGQDELSKLTLTILDFALHDPPVRASKEVMYFIDEHGLPTTEKEAVGKVTANIAVNDRPEKLLNIPSKEEAALEQQLRSQLDFVDEQLNQEEVQRNPVLLQNYLVQRKLLSSKLEFIKSRANSEGLTNEFIPRDQTLLGPTAPGPISPNILQYNQLLNTIRP